MRSRAVFILFSLVLGVLSWAVESIADYYALLGGKGNPWRSLLFVSPYEIDARVAVLLAFAAFGLVVAISFARRKRAEDALRQSEEKYKSLLEITDTGYVILDINGRVIDANAEYVRLTRRRSMDDIIGHSVMEWTAAYDIERNEQEIKKCLKEGCVRDLNIDYVSPEGQITPIEINAAVVETVEGLRIITLCRDITERKQTEEALRLMQFSIDHALDAAFWIDREARFTYVNEAACQSLGYSREELIGMTVFDIDPAFTHEKWEAAWQEMEQQGSGYVESMHKTKQGEVFPVEIATNYLEFAGKKYDFAFVRNISARKQAEENLLRRSHQLEILSNASRRLNAVLEIPAIMRTLVASALELVAAESGAGGLYTDGKIVVTEYNREGQVIPIDYTFDSGTGVPGWVAQTMTTYVSNDAEHDPHITPEIQKALGIYNLVDTPILSKDGRLLGVFEIYNTKDHRPLDAIDITMLQGLAASAAIALENTQLILERMRAAEERSAFEKQMEEQKDMFYRETIKSVTQGRLNLVSCEQVRKYLDSGTLISVVETPADTVIARHKITEFCTIEGLENDRLELFEAAVGEALTNAVKHAPKGWVYSGTQSNTIWVAISDNGPGISTLTLPGATLRRGYSTTASMGMGYSIMMEASDSVLLCTDPQGTTVVLSISIAPSEPAISLDDLKDTWGDIPMPKGRAQ